MRSLSRGSLRSPLDVPSLSRGSLRSPLALLLFPFSHACRFRGIRSPWSRIPRKWRASLALLLVCALHPIQCPPFLGARSARPSLCFCSHFGHPRAPSWARHPHPPPFAPSPPRGLSLLAPSGRDALCPAPDWRTLGGVCCAYRRLICLVAEFCLAVVALWSRWRSFGSPCRSRPTSALPLSGSCAQCAAGRAITPSYLGESGSGLRPHFLSAGALSLR